MNLRQHVKLAIRKFKRLLEFMGYGLFDTVVLASLPKIRRRAGVTAVIQLERLGDYFLWLPYGLALARDCRIRKERLVLVVNDAWAERIAADFPGCTHYPIDVKRLLRDLRYRAKTLRLLRRLAVTETIQVIYPRATSITFDAVARALGGWTVGFDAVVPDRPWLDWVLSRRLYRQRLPALPRVHQHARYRYLLRALEVRDIPGPGRLVLGSDFQPPLAPYFVIAPGASRALRCWPPERFVALGRLILDAHPSWGAVVVGTGSESHLGEAIARALGPRAENRTGGAGLGAFIREIAGARLVIGNDSAAGHIAAWHGIPSVIALGGMDFGRCYPYDPQIAPVARLPRPVWSPMDCFGCNGICRYPVRSGQAAPCIDAVSVEAMWIAVEGALSGPSDLPLGRASIGSIDPRVSTSDGLTR